MTNEERMKKGYLWLDTGESMDLQIHQRSLIYDFNHTRPDDLERRQELLKQIFGHLGEGVWVEPPLSASFGCTDTIGDRTYINSNLNLVDDLGITIGSDVLIAPNVTLINTGHPLGMAGGECHGLPRRHHREKFRHRGRLRRPSRHPSQHLRSRRSLPRHPGNRRP